MIVIDRNCKHCGQPFIRNIYPSQDKPGRHRFCSRSCSRSGTPASDEAKLSMAESGRARWARDGEKEAQSVRLTEFLSDPVNLAVRVVQINKHWESTETRLKASESAKQPHATEARKSGRRKAHANPEWMASYSKQMSETMSKPETVARSSEAHKLWWSGLSSEERDRRLQQLFESSLPYLQGQQRTSIEVAVEMTLIELGLVFVPQHPVDRCLLDFYLPDLGMVIECDGDYWHSLPGAKYRDMKRDMWLQSKGYIVIRITETEIHEDCRRAVLRALEVRNRVVAVRAARKSHAV